jgi:hypothetical protein
VKVGAIAVARMIVRDLIEAGHKVQIVVVLPNGSRIKERL